MKDRGLVRVTFDLELGTGEYEAQFENIDNPGEGIDLYKVVALINQIFVDVESDDCDQKTISVDEPETLN